MNQPFTIFFLSSVALRHVFQFLNPIELFEISQCSRKATNIISGTKRFEMSVESSSGSIVFNNYSFMALGRNRQAEYPPTGIRVFDGNTESADVCYLSENELLIYWDCPYIGFKTVLSHLVHLFNSTTSHLGLKNVSMPPHICLSIVELIRNRQTEIDSLAISSTTMSVEDISRIVNQFKVSESLEIYQYFPSDPNIPFTSKSVYISSSSWITLKHLNSMKHCTVIRLRESTLTDEDMTSFLESWNSGECPNLQYLLIRSNVLSKNFKVFGLPSLQDEVNKQWFEKRICGISPIIYCPVEYKRDDGVVAKIHFDKNDGDIQLMVM
ncbi:hypothetical protein CRE_22912 [Caenorhabditis remanei]|uniref:F-box domain-containing protein n=1 Tax=Caenorhabditis remanei TaxID=31234 RepID=E3MW26_CAERE|nr:hypothetical protein CRE_22912 [Caenorhabditis remanei]